MSAALRDSQLTVAALEIAGDAVTGRASGTVDFSGVATADVEYQVEQADLGELRALTNQDAAGIVSTRGRLTGPSDALHAVGDASIARLNAFDVTAVTLDGRYDVTTAGDLARTMAKVDGRGSFLTVAGQAVQDASGTVTVDAGRAAFDLQLTQAENRKGTLAGTMVLHPAERSIELEGLTVALGGAPWRLAAAGTAPRVSWNDEELSLTPMQFVGGAGDERIGLSGTWRSDGGGNLRVAANHVFLETLQGVSGRPARYGGVLDADLGIRGTRDAPIMAGTVTIAGGRVERVAYEKLAGRVEYANRMFSVDLRLDQGPGTWITAKGTMPLALFKRDLPEQPIDVAVRSSTINLGLVEGVTEVIHGVSGTIQLNVDAIMEPVKQS